MFERFTERARQVIVLAQDEARALRHHYIGTEHLLLGLLREEQGVGAAVLASLGIAVEEVRAKVAEIVGMGDELTSGQIPFTPRARKVLELSLREAISLGYEFIGTEHILLGLVRASDGVAARILLDFGADAGTVREAVIRTLSEPGRRREPLSPRPGAPRMSGAVELPSPGWEYRIEVWAAAGVDDRREWLALLGEQGWQLAAVVPGGEGFEWVFQRPKRGRATRARRWTAALLGRHGGESEPSTPLTVGRLARALADLREADSRRAEPELARQAGELYRELAAACGRITDRDEDLAASTMRVDDLVAAARTSKEAAVEEGRLDAAVQLRDLQRRLIELLEEIGELLGRDGTPGSA